jgi:N utilization substance protein A
LELEVPEIFNGTVEIKAIAREAGSRSKVAVHATQEGVDPVGSCVGVRGGRIQSVVNELGGEKIDVVQWDSEVSGFIANALSPAKVMNVLLSDDPDTGKTATVIVPDRQLSLAIGKEGQNARLAAKLTGWRIDIKSATETAEETLGRLEEAALSPEDMDLLSLAESLLRKREEDKFSEEEIALIKADVGVKPAEDRDGPVPAETEEPSAAEEAAEEVAHEEEPISAAEEVIAEPAMAVEVEAGERDFGDVESAEAEGARDLVAEEAAAAAEEAAASADQPEAEEGVEAEGRALDEVELETPFEGEPIEDSLGWVSTEPPEEFQYDYDWEEPAWEEVEAEKEEDWEPEELEEIRKEKKKKGRKRRGRSDFDYDLDDVYDPKWR